MDNLKSILVIPAWNEEKTIEGVVQLAALLKAAGAISDFAVINDCSTDRTAELAAKRGAKVISLGKHMGKGETFVQGALYCKRQGAGIMFTADSDILAGLTHDKFQFMRAELDVQIQGNETAMVIYPTTALAGTYGYSTRAEGNSGLRAIRMERLNFLFTCKPFTNEIKLSNSGLAFEFRDRSQGFGLYTALHDILKGSIRLLEDIRGAVLTLPTDRDSPARKQRRVNDIERAATKLLSRHS